ncbi:MAG: hypothetical protein AAF602_31355 [Myxococcota bacterium]
MRRSLVPMLTLTACFEGLFSDDPTSSGSPTPPEAVATDWEGPLSLSIDGEVFDRSVTSLGGHDFDLPEEYGLIIVLDPVDPFFQFTLEFDEPNRIAEAWVDDNPVRGEPMGLTLGLDDAEGRRLVVGENDDDCEVSTSSFRENVDLSAAVGPRILSVGFDVEMDCRDTPFEVLDDEGTEGTFDRIRAEFSVVATILGTP